MQPVTKKSEGLSANNLLLVMLLVSLIVVGATALVAKTMIGGIIRDGKVLGKWNEADKNVSVDLTNAPMLVSALSALGPQSILLQDALPNDSNFPGIIVAMENIAADSGMTLKSATPGPSDSADGTAPATPSSDSIDIPKPQTYSFSIAFDGTYTGLQKMLGDIETYDRPMRVTSIKLAGSGSSLSGTADIETFYQDQAKLPIGKDYVK